MDSGVVSAHRSHGGKGVNGGGKGLNGGGKGVNGGGKGWNKKVFAKADKSGEDRKTGASSLIKALPPGCLSRPPSTALSAAAPAFKAERWW